MVFSRREYGLIRFNIADYRKYYDRLMSDWHRSPSSRYAQLIDDIRNDTKRLSQFFETAGRVMDIDQKRQKSLNYISDRNKNEWINAKRRIWENADAVEIVYLSLTDRVTAYRFALERLVVGTPETQAAEVERVLINCRARSIAIARCRRPGCANQASLRTTEFLLAAFTCVAAAPAQPALRILKPQPHPAPRASALVPAPSP